MGDRVDALTLATGLYANRDRIRAGLGQAGEFVRNIRARTTGSPMRGRVLGADVLRRRPRRTRRRVPRGVKQFRKRVRKIVLNTNELKRCRLAPLANELAATDFRQREIRDITSNGCVIMPFFLPGNKDTVDPLLPDLGTGANQRIGSEFYSDYVRVDLHITWNILPDATPGGTASKPQWARDWYVGYKVIQISKSKPLPLMEDTGVVKRIVNPFTGNINGTIGAPSPDRGDYSLSNPSGLIASMRSLPAQSNMDLFPRNYSVWHNGAWQKGIKVIQSGTLCVPFAQDTTSVINQQRATDRSIYMPIKKKFSVERDQQVPTGIYLTPNNTLLNRTYLLIWAYNPNTPQFVTSGLGGGVPIIQVSTTHFFRDP